MSTLVLMVGIVYSIARYKFLVITHAMAADNIVLCSEGVLYAILGAFKRLCGVLAHQEQLPIVLDIFFVMIYISL